MIVSSDRSSTDRLAAPQVIRESFARSPVLHDTVISDPVYFHRCEATDPPETAVEQPGRGRQEHLLLVDDEPSLVRIWTAILEPLGYRVAAYTDSGQALEAFQAAPEAFDLVISDQVMPGLTGEALTRELLRLRPHLPIILCTGYSHSMTEDKAKALGARALLLKPVGRRDLCLTVERVLAHTAARSV